MTLKLAVAAEAEAPDDADDRCAQRDAEWLPVTGPLCVSSRERIAQFQPSVNQSPVELMNIVQLDSAKFIFSTRPPCSQVRARSPAGGMASWRAASGRVARWSVAARADASPGS